LSIPDVSVATLRARVLFTNRDASTATSFNHRNAGNGCNVFELDMSRIGAMFVACYYCVIGDNDWLADKARPGTRRALGGSYQ
jgi:hypothetical protein